MNVYNYAIDAGEVTTLYTEGTPTTDTTAPTAPTALVSSNTTQTNTTLSWTASTDAVGVTGYIVYRNEVEVGTPTTTSFTDTGLTANT